MDVLKLKGTNPQHYVPHVGRSDHSVVLCSPGLRPAYEPPSINTISSRRQGPQQRQKLLEALLPISWEPLYRASTCEEQYAMFDSIMTRLINTHLPVQQKRRCTTDRPWVTDHFKDLLRKRQSAFKSGNATVYNFYRNKVNRLSKYLQREHYNTKIDSLCSNSGQWWKDIKQIAGLKSGGDNLQCLANSKCGGDMAALASKINDFLQSVTSDFVPISQQDDFTNGSSPSVPDNRIISVADVQTKLNKINIKKATGPDNIPDWILRDGACSLAGPTCALFNSSMREEYVPQIWESANIFPLAKVNPPSILEKHIRPISLTPT